MTDLNLGDTRQIIAECERNGLLRTQIAYVLATAYWETAHTVEPVVEAFWKSEDWRKKNLRYYPWHGRGYVQLTWERNYQVASDKLGVDLIANPNGALNPDIACRVLVVGMIEGWFTGRKLTDYITEEKKDYRGARRMINGTDKAANIAAIAEEYETALGLAGIGRGPEFHATTMPTLRMGNSSPRSAVMMLQQDLASLGYHAGAADGVFGRHTRAAVMSFQADNGLTADGIVGPATWAALETAKPAPARLVSVDHLRKKGSGTIKDADRAEKVAKAGTATVLGGIGLDTVLDGAQTLSGAEGLLQAAQRILVENWLILVAAFAAAFLFFALPELTERIRQRRLADHTSGRNMGR